MHIFQQEKEDGLEHVISSSASLVYASVAAPCPDPSTRDYRIKHIKSLASLEDSDLYYVQSILVSSSWNKNDDIFDKAEVWVARHTPEDKPTNLEHDEHNIIGHITSNWPITTEGSMIDDMTSVVDLPEKYHIVTGSVIYKAFSDPDLRARSQTLIEEIEAGDKYVSMECFFKGFDYGILTKSTGEYKILGRDESSAYLTKHLRSYGGTGEHEDYKIGRVLRQITFSGKGFVNKPANPDSIIFTKQSINLDRIKTKEDDLINLGVLLDQPAYTQENINMNPEITTVISDITGIKTQMETIINNKQVEENLSAMAANQKKDIVRLEQENVVLQETVSQQASQIVVMEQTLENQAAEQDKAEAAKKTKEELDKEEDDAEPAMMKKMKAELDLANETIATYHKKEEEMMKKAKKMKRVASMMEVGLDHDSASIAVDQFESLEDETFDYVTNMLSAKMPPWLLDKFKKKEDKPADKKKASETTEIVDPSVLDTAEIQEETNLGIGGPEVGSALESTRAALVEFVYTRIGKKL